MALNEPRQQQVAGRSAVTIRVGASSTPADTYSSGSDGPVRDEVQTNASPVPAHPAAAADAGRHGNSSQQPEEEKKSAVFFELRRRMLRLYSSSLDAKDHSCLDDLNFIQRCVEDRSRPALAACVVQLGFFELCQHILAENFWRPDLFNDAATLQLMSLVLGVVADATDGNSQACEHVLSVDFQKDLFEVLRAEKLDPSKVKFGEQHCFIADCVMAVLYNVIQETTEARELYRDEDAVHVFGRFRLNTSDSVSCQALILQAYVINEDENELLGSDDRSFQFLAGELSYAVNSDESRSFHGYRTDEVLAAINKLSVHDANKRRIIDSGVLDSYTRLLSPAYSVSEQLLTTQGLWTLAMDCPQDVAKQDGCVQSLQQLMKDSEDDALKRQVRGVLNAVGAIKDHTRRPVSASQPPLDTATTAATTAAGTTTTTSSGSSHDTKHIFISYNHGSKKTVLRLRDQLKAAGFVVWVDEEGVYESIADDIITGLDSANVVLVCMSQKYYESPYCKKELVYAAESYKKIVPLTLEPRYNPHGWLRFHTSDGLRYDFSNNESFEDSFKKLVRMLKKCYSSSDENVQRLEQIHSTETAAAAAAAATAAAAPHVDVTPVSRDDDEVKTNTRVAGDSGQPGVSSWTCGDVTRWLADNRLLSLKNWFAGFDGDLLLEYKSYRHGSSHCLAACVQDELHNARLSLADVMRLNKALRQL